VPAAHLYIGRRPGALTTCSGLFIKGDFKLFKGILFIIVLMTTALRLVTMAYLLIMPSNSLSFPVLAVTAVIVVYGMLIIFRRLFLSVRLQSYMWFFIAQAIAFIFNMIYIVRTTPLKLTPYEIIAVGTFLDILVAVICVYYCAKRIYKEYISF
jgi:hypothetical protein